MISDILFTIAFSMLIDSPPKEFWLAGASSDPFLPYITFPLIKLLMVKHQMVKL